MSAQGRGLSTDTARSATGRGQTADFHCAALARSHLDARNRGSTPAALVQPPSNLGIVVGFLCERLSLGNAGQRRATPGIAAKAKREQIYLDQRYPDHAPLIVDYDFKL